MCLHKNEVIFILTFFSQKCLSTSKLYWYQDIQLDKNNTWARALSFHQYFLEMEYFSYFSSKKIHERTPYCTICILKAFCTKNTERKPVIQHFRYAFKQSLWSNNYHFCCSIKAFYRESSGHPSKFEHPSFFCNIITRLAVLCDWCLLRWERRKIFFFW